MVKSKRYINLVSETYQLKKKRKQTNNKQITHKPEVTMNDTQTDQ